MRKLAFVFTQLTIFNIVNLKLTILKNDIVDLIAFSPSATDSFELIKKLQERKLFERVLILENYYPREPGVRRVVNCGRQMINAGENKNRIREFIGEYVYDEFFTYGSNMEAYIAYNEINKNKKVKFTYYEEGIGTYFNTIHNALKPWWNLRLKTLNVDIPVAPSELWVNMPEMLNIPLPANVMVRRLPTIIDKDMVNDIWNYEPSFKKASYKTIFFEQTGTNSLSQFDIFSIFNRETTVVKFHPRTRDQQLYNDANKLDCQNIIWEIYCLNNPNMENLVFVSEFSTACFTPKILFGMEPTIIFTKHLYKNNVNNEVFETMVNKLRHIYDNKEKIIVPQSHKELKIEMSRLGL